MAAISKNSELEGLCSQKKFSLERGVLALKLSKLSKVDRDKFQSNWIKFSTPSPKVEIFLEQRCKNKKHPFLSDN